MGHKVPFSGLLPTTHGTTYSSWTPKDLLQTRSVIEQLACKNKAFIIILFHLWKQIEYIQHGNQIYFLLTLWEPVYEYIVLRFRPQTEVFGCLTNSADSARELFKSSNGLASLLACTRKKFFWLGLWIFCEWSHKWSSFWVILAHVSWPRAQPLGRSVTLKFALETRLKSESFEPLIDFLAFLVQKLWSQMNKLII